MPKIVLVEDEAPVSGMVIDLIKMQLGEEAEVSHFTSAIKAWEYIMAHSDVQLVITDVNTEEEESMNGIELCRAVKQAFSHVTVIVMSGRNYHLEALENGADFYLSKPFPLAEMINAIKESLE